MTVTDLHPDHLFDRERRGDLTPAERAVLDAHVAHCVSCRFERRVHAEFRADDETNDVAALPTGLLVARVLEQTVVEAPAPVAASSSRRPWLRRRRAMVLLLAASLTLVAAAVTAGPRTLLAYLFAPTSAPPPVAPPPGETARAKRGPMRAVDVAESPPASSLPEIPTPPPPATVPVADPPSPIAMRSVVPVAPPAPSSPSRRSLPADGAIEAPSSKENALSASPSREVPERPQDDAASLFAQGNAARGRGDYGAAAQLYRDLLARFPGAPEATPTRVALGRLLLDGGDAAGALALFDQYGRGGEGTLREEALAGRARALQRLGRSEQERAAWTTLLERYPGSVHGDRARARIAELAPR